MRDDSVDTVTSGGPSAPLGARTASRADASLADGVRPAALLVVLVLALVGYAALAADVVHDGAVSELDSDVAVWVAQSMPGWAEWLARPFTWLGGAVGMTLVVTATSIALLRRGAGRDAIVLVVVAIGSQVLVLTAKGGYERHRPHVGSAISLPSSFSFPSGHATASVAVLALLGLYAAAFAGTRARRVAFVAGGLALGALVGTSRVVLNVHYVSDVVAGACLGLAWLCTCLLVDRWLRARRARTFAV